MLPKTPIYLLPLFELSRVNAGDAFYANQNLPTTFSSQLGFPIC